VSGVERYSVRIDGIYEPYTDVVRATDYDHLARRVAQLEQVLRVCRATLPHMGGNPMSTHSLCADIDAALKGQG
jgi:hypothetical protein